MCKLIKLNLAEVPRFINLSSSKFENNQKNLNDKY